MLQEIAKIHAVPVYNIEYNIIFLTQRIDVLIFNAVNNSSPFFENTHMNNKTDNVATISDIVRDFVYVCPSTAFSFTPNIFIDKLNAKK